MISVKSFYLYLDEKLCGNTGGKVLIEKPPYWFFIPAVLIGVPAFVIWAELETVGQIVVFLGWWNILLLLCLISFAASLAEECKGTTTSDIKNVLGLPIILSVIAVPIFVIWFGGLALVVHGIMSLPAATPYWDAYQKELKREERGKPELTSIATYRKWRGK